jgi:hypothetical protein
VRRDNPHEQSREAAGGEFIAEGDVDARQCCAVAMMR